MPRTTPWRALRMGPEKDMPIDEAPECPAASQAQPAEPGTALIAAAARRTARAGYLGGLKSGQLGLCPTLPGGKGSLNSKRTLQVTKNFRFGRLRSPPTGNSPSTQEKTISSAHQQPKQRPRRTQEWSIGAVPDSPRRPRRPAASNAQSGHKNGTAAAVPFEPEQSTRENAT